MKIIGKFQLEQNNYLFGQENGHNIPKTKMHIFFILAIYESDLTNKSMKNIYLMDAGPKVGHLLLSRLLKLSERQILSKWRFSEI